MTNFTLYPVDDGYVISVDGGWYPGTYATKATAIDALNVDEELILEAMKEGNVLTAKDINRMRKT